MKKLLFAIFVLMLTVVMAQAQSSGLEDVVHLKNQWVIRGRLFDENNTIIKIRTRDGNIFAFLKSDIDSISKAPPIDRFEYKRKGFAHFTELGPLIAGKTSIDGVTTAAFSFQTVNGYKFSQWAMAGVAIGADLYATQTIIPVSASFRGDLTNHGSLIPFYFGDLGYGFNITQNSASGTDFKGGLSYGLGLGLKIPFNRNAGFLLSVGYRYQYSSYTITTVNTPVIYNRLAVRAGFFL